jgi:hypothetical protein
MQSKGFAKAYYESRIGRIVDEFLDTLKEKIHRNEPKEKLIQLIDSIYQDIHKEESQGTYSADSVAALA